MIQARYDGEADSPAMTTVGALFLILGSTAFLFPSLSSFLRSRE